MAFLKLLLYNSLIMLGTASTNTESTTSTSTRKLTTTATSINTTIDKNFDNACNLEDFSQFLEPEHYDILLYTITNKNYFYGMSNASVKIYNKRKDIGLHVQTPHIMIYKDTITLINLKTLHSYFPKKYTYCTKRQIIIFHFDDELSPGRYTLRATFANFISDDGAGMFNTSYINKKGDKKETAISYNERKDSPGHKLNVVQLIAREVAYQMFSNRVSPWWSYMWLNEGIAMLFGLDAVDKTFPDLRVLDLFVVQIQQESLRLDTHSIMTPLVAKVSNPSEINSLFSFSYYIKGPAILRMLQHALTDTIFRNGVQKYLRIPKATDKTFWNSMQTALEVSNFGAKYNVKGVYNSWTTMMHYPVLEVTQDQENVIHIKCKNIDTLNSQNFSILVKYITESHLNFNDSWNNEEIWFSSINFNAKEISIQLNMNDSLMIINTQQTGYYRVNYDTKHWLKLATFLNLSEYHKIHVLNRAQIIDDSFYFLMNNQLDLNTYLKLVKYLWQEIDYVVWYPMIKTLEHISCFFPFDESTYIKQQLLGVINKFYVARHKSSSNLIVYYLDSQTFPLKLLECLREEFAKWACILGSTICLRKANLILHLHSRGNSFLPWWKNWVCCNGLTIDHNNIAWNKMFDTYINKSDNTILKFLACSVKPSVICNYMKLITSDNYNKYISINDRITIFHSIVTRHANNGIVLNYILDNLEEVKSKEISMVAALIDIINHVYSEARLMKITEFINNLNETYTFIIKNAFHPEGRILINERPECIWNYMECTGNKILLKYKLFVKRKIEIRLSEIQKQKTYFKYLMP